MFLMQQVDFFKALADDTRLNIVLLLVSKGELCVCDLTEFLNLSQPKISHKFGYYLYRSSKYNCE